MTALNKLTAWYRAQCNESWEHSFGVSIGTLDNPGWLVKIDLNETALEWLQFSAKAYGDPGADESWISCKVEGKQFVGAGGTNNLEEVLNIFLAWSEEA